MIVRAAADYLVTPCEELGAHSLGIRENLLLVLHILGLHGLEERHCLGRNHVLERTALHSGEHHRIQHLAHHLDCALRSSPSLRILEVLAYQYDTSSGPAQGLVSCGGHDVCVLNRILEQTCGNDSCRVSHIHPEDCPDLVGYLPHPLIIPLAGVCRSSADNQLGTALQGLALHLVIVHHPGLGVQPVGNGVVEKTGSVDGRAVGEVATLAQVQTHKGVSGLEDCHLYCHIGLGSAMRLDIRPLGAVDGLDAVDGELLYLVHDFAPSVVPLPGVALCILVGADRPHSFEYFVRYIVFGGNKFKTRLLALPFLLDQIGNKNILLHTFMVC